MKRKATAPEYLTGLHWQDEPNVNFAPASQRPLLARFGLQLAKATPAE
jgi:hypothetical protein